MAAGIPIEALTGDAAMEAQRNEREQLAHIRGLLKGSADPAQAIGDLLKSNAKMAKDIEAFQREAAGNVKGDLIAGLKTVNGVQVCGAILDLDAKNIKDLAFQLKAEHAPFFGVFGSSAGGKVTLSIAISDDVVAERDLHAGNLVRELAAHIGGGGGGQAFFATAGKNADGLQAAIDAALAKVAGLTTSHKRRPSRRLFCVRNDSGASRRHRHVGGAVGFASGFTEHGTEVIFFLTEAQVQDVKDVEHACEDVVQGAVFAKVFANSKMVLKKK